MTRFDENGIRLLLSFIHDERHDGSEEGRSVLGT